MEWLLWMAIGLACGISIGYEELGKKIRLRIKKLYFGKEVRFIDGNGEEINDDSLIHLLFTKKKN